MPIRGRKAIANLTQGNNISDPLGQPTIPAGSDQYFCICCPSVRSHFSNLEKKLMVATGETVGLAEWIIDDTCLVFSRSDKHLISS